LPYSMLRKGWDSGFRGLATFDLSTGLFVPFLLATSCVVIAAATQFHARFDPVEVELPAAEISGEFRSNLEKRLAADEDAEAFAALDEAALNAKIDALPIADRQLAVMLVKRDAFDLAKSLENLFGEGGLTQRIFGVGVLGMAVSTIIILMVINGFCVTELTSRAGDRVVHRLGAVLPGVVGGLGFLAVWGDDQARFWLAVPTSNFGMALLPIAYVTFFLMMNNRSLLGDAMPRGLFRLVANLVMLLAIAVAGVGAGMSIYANLGWGGMAAVGVFIALIFAASFMHSSRQSAA
jgi:hypothetical protein